MRKPRAHAQTKSACANHERMRNQRAHCATRKRHCRQNNGGGLGAKTNRAAWRQTELLKTFGLPEGMAPLTGFRGPF